MYNYTSYLLLLNLCRWPGTDPGELQLPGAGHTDPTVSRNPVYTGQNETL